MKKSYQAFYTIVLIIGLLFAMVVSSLAWFSANDFLSTNKVIVTSSQALSMKISIPSHQTNADSYMGQTGIEYEGIDSPYVLKYQPVSLSIELGSEAEYYMVCEITNVNIEKVIGSTTENLTTQEILSNFTWRFGVKEYSSVYNPETGQYENVFVERLYKNNNGFLYDYQTGKPFRVYDGLSYQLTYYLYFLGEEGLSLMTDTMSNISNQYKFKYSDLSYMWSTFSVDINIGVRELYTVNFDSMGGSQCQSIPTTGGTSILLPTPTIEDNTKYFGGWYDNSSFSGQPFDADTLINTPRRGDFTLYAKWLDKFVLSFDTQGSSQPIPTTQYLLPDQNTMDPQSTGDIIAWTTTPMTYEEYATNPTPYVFDTPITQDTTLYAVRRTQYMITLHMDTNYGGSGYLIVDEIMYDSTYTFYVFKDQTIPNIYTPTGDSLNFRKWSKQSNTTTTLASEYNFDTPVTSEVHLYAYYSVF